MNYQFDSALWPTFIVFFIGSCIGSFLNVCIHRIPQKVSIVYPGSSCPKCGKGIAWWENIPILSYIFLGGRCSGCKSRISMRYPIVEILSGSVALVVFYRFGISLQFFYYFFFLALLIVISFIDLEHKIIPDVLSLTGIVIGALISHFVADHGLFNSILGIVLGGGILFLVAWGYFICTRREGLGGGDIKLLAMIGAFLGWKAIPFVLFLSALTGSIFGGILILVKGAGRHSEIPYGPFLSLGAAVYLICPNFEKLFLSLLV